MPSINVGESDFPVLAKAAQMAKEAGDDTHAAELDKIARKVNAALSNATLRGAPFIRQSDGIKWTDVPSTLL